MNKALSTLALAALLSFGSGAQAAPEAGRDVGPVLAPVQTHNAALVHANYEDTLHAAQAMKRAIDAFLASPSADTQQAAQKAWRAAREFYGQTEAFRFYGGPIDDDKGPEGRLNAWPMDESYVDKVEGGDNAGLINDRSFAITPESISEQNERGGEENIATGWHAIEFLLWGQGLSESGPGNRAFTDFVDGKATNADRRRQYLAVVTDLLIEDLNTLVKAWRPESKLNYRARFVEGGQESLRKMFVAMGSLSCGELAGERLEVALNSQDQEDEHSCFSDNTHRDAVLNATGIENVWLGRYKRADGTLLQGPSPRDMVAARDAALLVSPAPIRAAAFAAPRPRLAAAWQTQRGYQVGILGFTSADAPSAVTVEAALDVPTRAHGLLLEPAGTLLALTRRPGDWLLCWSPEGQALACRWIEPGRAFAGHALASADGRTLASADGRTLYTTELDLDTGAGLIGARDGESLEKRAEWPTLGRDPHQLAWDASRPGGLIVANGGVPTRPETDRAKRDLARMDASLVRLDAATGECLGQWRLDDPRLSLRHLAWNGRRLGIALQAEHDEGDVRSRAPVLTVFDGQNLNPVPAPQPLAGYGGDIAAFDDGFAVSCPRVQAVAHFGQDGRWRGLAPLAEACALAAASEGTWAGGRSRALNMGAGRTEAEAGEPLPDLRLDNHWIALA